MLHVLQILMTTSREMLVDIKDFTYSKISLTSQVKSLSLLEDGASRDHCFENGELHSHLQFGLV